MNKIYIKMWSSSQVELESDKMKFELNKIELIPAKLAIVTICPWLLSIIAGKNAFTVQKWLIEFTFIVPNFFEKNSSNFKDNFFKVIFKLIFKVIFKVIFKKNF